MEVNKPASIVDVEIWVAGASFSAVWFSTTSVALFSFSVGIDGESLFNVPSLVADAVLTVSYEL